MPRMRIVDMPAPAPEPEPEAEPQLLLLELTDEQANELLDLAEELGLDEKRVMLLGLRVLVAARARRSAR